MKRRILKIIFSFSILLCLSFETYGQFGFQNPKILNTDNGLGHNWVHSLDQDQNGFIWLGTDNGLYRFDGTQLKAFTPDTKDATSISHSRIYDVFEDKETSEIWVGTSMGLSIYNPKTENFRTYHPDASNPNSLTDDIVRYIYKDRQGQFWLSCWTKGIVKYNKEKDHFEPTYFDFSKKNQISHVSFEQEAINKGRVNSVVHIVQDVKNDSIIWFGTLSGLIKYNKYTEGYELFFNITADKNLQYSINSMIEVYPHRNGKIYLGSFAHPSTFDPRTHAFQAIIPPKTNANLPDELRYAHTIIEKSPHELWVTYRTGLLTLNTQTDKITDIKINRKAEQKLYGAMLKDKDGRVWTGTPINGAYLFNPLQQQVSPNSYVSTNPDWTYVARSIIEVPDGKTFYLCVIQSDGLYIFDREQERWKIIPPPIGYQEANGFQGNDLLLLEDGTLLVLGKKKIYQYQTGQDRLTLYTTQIENDAADFKRIFKDERGNLWITSRRDGVYYIDHESQQVKHYREELNDAEAKTQYVWVEYIFEDSRGNIWIRLARTFCIYDPRIDTLIKFPYKAGGASYTYKYARNFAEDKFGRVWIASEEEGLGVTDPNNISAGIIRKFTTKDSLASNRINYIEADAKGNIWILTDKGLSQLDPDKMQFKNFDWGYGIPKGSILKLLSTGEMAIGYNKGGIGFFHPDSLINNRELPQPYVSSFKVFDKEQQLEYLTFNKRTIDLSYRNNFFSFEFSSIGFTIPEKNKYAYKLEGYDEDWNYNNRRYAAYTNVEGGDYTFKLKAANNENIWNETPFELKIYISTPWWKTWWFRSAIVLFIAGLFYAGYLYRIGQIKKEERLKTEFEKKLANVEMNALRAQMNPHFIFNSLNSIDFYIIKNETKKASDYLNRFSRLIRLILQNSRSNYVTLKDDLEALKLYMEMESLRFNNRFDYEVIVEKGLDIESIEIPPMLFQPYIENAIWHGLMHKNGNGKVSLLVSRENGHLKCIIEDDGIGRERAFELKSKNATKKKSMGMRITKDRINMINKLYNSNTTVNIIDLKNEKGEALGTKVELNIPI